MLEPTLIGAWRSSELGDSQAAVADYDEAIRLQPDDAGAYFGRGLARTELGSKRGSAAGFRDGT